MKKLIIMLMLFSSLAYAEGYQNLGKMSDMSWEKRGNNYWAKFGEYQPEPTNVWTEIAGLPEGRTRGIIVGYAGKVYFIGGYKTSHKYDTYVFNGTSWSDGVDINSYCTYGGAVIFNSRLYVFSGSVTPGELRSWAVGEESWTSHSNYPTFGRYHAESILTNRVFLVGGTNLTVNTNAYYSDDLENWTAMAPLPKAVNRSTMVSYNNKIYVMGGYDGTTYGITNVFSHDGNPESSWVQEPPLPIGAWGKATVVNNKIYLVQLMTSSASGVTNCYAFDGSSWTEIAGLPWAVTYSSGAAVMSNKLYIAGGNSDGDSPYGTVTGITNAFKYSP